MGVDLFSMPSYLEYLNKVSGDNEVMDLLVIYSDNQNYFELEREEIKHLAEELLNIGTDVAIDTSNGLYKMLSNYSDSNYFIFHLG